MVTEIFALAFLLTVGNVAHCQDWENLLFIKMEVLIEKQEAALMKQEAALSQLQEIQEKQEHIEGKLQEMQEKLQHVEINLQGQQELESSLRQEVSGVISLLETGGIDECLEGSHNCGDHELCTDKFYQFSCSCLPGFARDGSRCEDIDECAQGKDECSPLATCRNSVGSYSCSCNPPFEGDGRTCSCPPGFAQKGSNCEDIDECSTQGKAECSPQATCRNSVGSYSCSCNPPFEGDGRTCEFSCESPARVLEGLGCVKHVTEAKTFEEMKDTCHQAGWRLLQDYTIASLQEVRRAFGYLEMWMGWVGRTTSTGWVGVQGGRWLESGLPLQEELWVEGSRGSDPSRRRGLCGSLRWDPSSSSSFKVGELDCSVKDWGYCQFVTPQK